MQTVRDAFAAAALVLVAAATACLPGSGPPLNPYEDDAGAAPPLMFGDDGGGLLDVDLGPAFAITGLQPSHGPWTGGTRTTIAGRGFASSIQVQIGSTLLASSDVFASSPTRASLVTPRGSPGPVDVIVRNIRTAEVATLAGGFFYDAFEVTPSGGATTGGTRIALVGSQTHWTSDSTVTVGGKPCGNVSFGDGSHLSCSTPPNGPGSQAVAVTNADGSVEQALDAFLYSDSPDGYRGGLYGGALSGTLKVLAFDALTGTPLVGGSAIAGSTIGGAIVGTFDASGTVQLVGPSLTGKVTVTIAATCHQPMTYVDVPVDTVTAYLAPELLPSCAGDPPSGGNYSVIAYGGVSGELVWPASEEFKIGGWNNVPLPRGPNEKQTAYVWTATGSRLDAFQLPPPSSATTPALAGQRGYTYSLGALPGNQTLYALAGLEDRTATPPRFEPYAMGVARGISVLPGATIAGVDIPMSTTLDRVVAMMPMPPPPMPLGPDRLVSTLAINLGAGSFAVLPQGTTTTLLPLSGAISLLGVPALDNTLSSATYDLTAAAVTGPSHDQPRSVVTGIDTTDANDPVSIGGFFAIPTLVEPAAATWGGTHVTVLASGPIDLVNVAVVSGGGLLTWQIVAPGSALSFDVPDLSQMGIGSLIHGPISSTVSIARIAQFDYGTLRSGQLATPAWSAYAQNTFAASY